MARDPAAADDPENARQSQPWERQAAEQIEPALFANEVRSLHRRPLESQQEIGQEDEAQHPVDNEDDVGDWFAEWRENQEDVDQRQDRHPQHEEIEVGEC